MKKFSIIFMVLALVAAPLCLVRADGEEHSPIETHMEAVNDAYKLLRRQARRKTFDDESIKHVQTMQVNAVQAMHQPFPKMDALSGEAKKKMLIGYRKKMVETIKNMLDLEIALLEGRADDAAALVNKLATDKNEGHDKYTDETG